MNYPIILIPKILLVDNYKSYKVEIPELPEVPKMEKVELEKKSFFSLSGWLILVAFFLLTTGEEELIKMGFVLMAILIIYKIIKGKNIDSENELKIKKAIAKLEQRIIEYKNAVIERDSAIAKQRFIKENQVERIGTKHKVAIIELLIREKNIRVFKNEDSVKKGVTENQFLDLLVQKFNDRILTDYSVSDGSMDWPYTPDFIYYDDVRHIYICIEIDEPYVLQTGKPIHFIRKDETRDDFFYENMWCVFRFAEYQIVTEPENCIHLLEDVIRCLELGVTDYSSKLSTVEGWSEADSEEMALNNFRENYLGISPVDRTKYLENTSHSETLAEDFVDFFDEEMDLRIYHSKDKIKKIFNDL